MNETTRTHLGRYQLLNELGRGGMSTVYLAKDPELEREVAIKCVEIGSDDSLRLAHRLRSEAKLLAKLNHAHIVQLFDVVEEVVEQDGLLGLVIEYLGADTLTRRLEQNPSRELVLKWLAEVAEGLSCAHQQGIAHCDIKSDNILITDDNVAKIADFGIAKVRLSQYLVNDSSTRMATVSGSYTALSPEQAMGAQVDTRTDLFSLGVLIHYCLTHTHPFGDTRDKAALLDRVLNTTVVLSDQAKSALGPRLSELVGNLLNKDPENRIYSAAEAAELLRGAQKEHAHSQTVDSADVTQTIASQSPTHVQQVSGRAKTSSQRKWAGRLALVVTGFIVGAVIIQWQSHNRSKTPDVEYLALDVVEVTTSPEFNSELLPAIKSTLQESAENALLSLRGKHLVPEREYRGIQGNYLSKAKATGASAILELSADCGQHKCDIKLRKFEGDKMAVAAQRSWPIAVQTLVDIRSTLRDEIHMLFPDSSSSRQSYPVSEQVYRRYTDLLLESRRGDVSLEHLRSLDTLIQEQPFFLPAYDLARRLSQQLAAQSSEATHLAIVETILDRVPKSLNEEASVLAVKIYLHLQRKEFDKAERLFSFAKTVVDDTPALLNLETNIAYYANQADRLLAVDRQNAVLRPSSTTLHNLAASEYSQGNYAQAQVAVEQALKLHPENSFSLSLRATIAMRQGDLSSAIDDYNAAIAINDSSSNRSNLGLALLLSNKYQSAVDQFKQAKTKSSGSSTYTLNLADAYNLNDQARLAAKHYEEVIDLTEGPTSAAQFRQRAQAFAQLGNFFDAVKTLNSANRKYPEDGNLKHAAAVVYAISNDSTAAVVAVEDALSKGTGKVWFTLPWFKSLCSNQTFRELTQPDTRALCEAN